MDPKIEEQVNKMINRKRQQGLSTVEFAFVAGVFFSLVLGGVQFGSWLMDRTVVMNAALEGARVFAASRHYATPYGWTRKAVNDRLPAKFQVADKSPRMKLTVTNPKTNTSTAPCYTDADCRTVLGTDTDFNSTDNPINVNDATCLEPGTTASVNLQWDTPIFWNIRLPGSMTVTMTELVQGASTKPCP